MLERRKALFPSIHPLLLCASVLLPCALSLAAEKPPLFARLGGMPVVRKATEHFLSVLAEDPRLMKNPELRQLTLSLKKERLVRELSERVCAVSGGPCPMIPGILDKLGPEIEISPLEWAYLLQDLDRTLAKFGIRRADQAEFVGIVLKRARAPR
ncbi:MAG: hypothetical protein NDJ89_12885 [Oligoflexia bacterium]|nr:hypothetical protein [Oligoflexia bacterium]